MAEYIKQIMRNDLFFDDLNLIYIDNCIYGVYNAYIQMRGELWK